MMENNYTPDVLSSNILEIPPNMIRISLLKDQLNTKDGIVNNLIMSMTKEDLIPITDQNDKLLSYKCKKTFKIIEDPHINPNIDFELLGFKINESNKSKIDFNNMGKTLIFILGGPDHYNGVLEITKFDKSAKIMSKNYETYNKYRYYMVSISKEFLVGASITVSHHQFVLIGNSNEDLHIHDSPYRLNYLLDISSLENATFGPLENYLNSFAYEDDY